MPQMLKKSPSSIIVLVKGYTVTVFLADRSWRILTVQGLPSSVFSGQLISTETQQCLTNVSAHIFVKRFSGLRMSLF